MAGVKISNLPAASSAVASDVFPADQSSGTVTRKIQLSQVATLFNSNFVQLTPSADQTITANNLTLATGSVFATVGNYSSGSSAGGFVGAFKAYSTTAAKGSITLQAADNSANYGNVLTNASTTAARTWTLPDASGTLALSTQGISWSSIAGTTQAAAVNSGYVVSNAAQTTITLPATAALGSVVEVVGLGAGGWILTANTGQVIHVDGTATSSGGTVTSAAQYNTISVVCVVANTTWVTRAGVTAGYTVA